MPVLIKDDKVVIFRHIPKTGGTTLERILKKAGISVTLFSTKLHGRKGHLFPCSPQHFHHDIIRNMFSGFNFYYDFAVVRDPIERMKSEYRHRQKNMQLVNKAIPCFDDWLVESINLWRENPYYKDNHFRPQHQFISENTEIFKLENGMKAVVDKLSEIFEEDLSVYADMRLNEGLKSDINVSSSSISLIRDVYARDFEIFKYEGPKVSFSESNKELGCSPGSLETRKNVPILPYIKPWKGGVFSGELPEIGRIRDQKMRLVDIPPSKLPKIEPKFLAGKYLYGGPFYNHFGHIIVDSMVRAYAFEDDQYSGVVFTVVKTKWKPSAVPNYFYNILQAFGIPKDKVIFIDRYTLVESLDFAEPSTYVTNGVKPWYRVHLEKVEKYFLGRVPKDRNDFPKKIFLGRSHISSKGFVAGEKYLYELASKKGFVYFKPENHSLSEQVYTLKNAEEIIWVEGSSIYPIDFISGAIKARTLMIPRRKFGHGIFKRILSRFQDVKITNPRNVLRLNNPAGVEKPNSISVVEDLDLFSKEFLDFIGVDAERFDQDRFKDVEKADIEHYYLRATSSKMLVNAQEIVRSLRA